MLQYLKETLNNAASIVDGSRQPYDKLSTSDSDSSDEDGDGVPTAESLMPTERQDAQDVQDTELRQLLRGVCKIIANLFKMSALIRKGNSNQDRILKASKIDVSHFEPYDLRHVRDKFPHAGDKLIERMGMGISRRRQYLKYRENHHQKLAGIGTKMNFEVGNQAQEQEVPVIEPIAPSKSVINAPSREPIDDISKSISVMQSTNASTFLPSKFPSPVNLDVDVYSEADTQTSYASSFEGEKKLRLPPLPESSRNGQDFECPYCYTICRLNGVEEWQRRKEWKRHVYKDLQPYMCTFASCWKGDKMFERRRDWINHETLLHRREWTCNVAGHSTYHSREGFTAHLRSEHPDLDPSNDGSAIVALFERSSTTAQAPCPFCFSEDTKGISMSRLEKHMAQHMEALALFALPTSHGTDDKASIDSGARVLFSQMSATDLDSGVSLSEIANADTEIQHAFEPEDLDEFDSLFNAFVQDNASLIIPKHFLESLDFGKEYEPDVRHTDLEQRVSNILQMLTEAQPLDTINLRDFMKQLHFRLYTHSQFNEYARRPKAFFLTGVIVALAEKFTRLPDDIDYNTQETQTYLQNIGQRLFSCLTAPVEGEAHVDEANSLDLNWDYVHSRHTISEDILGTLSKVLAKSESVISIYDTTLAASDPERERFRNLGRNVGLILQLLKGPRLDPSVAKEAESLVRAQEYAILSFCNDKDRPVLAKTPCSGIVDMVDQLLSLSGASPFRNRGEQMIQGTIKADAGTVDEITTRMNNHCLTHSVKHQAFHDALCPDSFAWFFNDPKYTDWASPTGIHNNDRLLRVAGNPGCGKTMLCSAVIDSLKNWYSDFPEAIIAYYYCTSRDFRRTKAYEVILSLVVQTCVHLNVIPDRVRDLYEKVQASDDTDEMLAVNIADIVSSEGPTFFIVDGLDQILDSPRVMNWLSTVLDQCSHVRCLFTHRMTSQMLATWAYDYKPPAITFDEDKVSPDIISVVDQGLEEWYWTSNLRSLVRESIQRQAHGIMTVAVLQVKAIRACHTEEAIKSVLGSAPAELLKAWQDKLTQVWQVWDSTADVVKRMLEILMVAAVEISIDELDSILSLTSVKDSPKGDSSLSATYIIDLCSNFLALKTPNGLESETSYGSQQIQWIHPWFRSFYRSSQDISERQANLDLAIRCVDHLLSHDVSRWVDKSDKMYLFFRYAARCWFIHAKRADTRLIGKRHISDDYLVESMWTFFNSTPRFSSWLAIYDPDSSENLSGKDKAASPFYYACYLGFPELAQSFMSRSKNPSALMGVKGGKHKYPLLAAIESGHSNVVQLLLENHDDPNRTFKNRETGLIRAASRDNTYIVELLLDHGADVNATTKRALTALHSAVRNGCEGVVPILLERGADVNALDVDGRSPIHYTTHFDVPNGYLFKLLLEAGTDISLSDRFGDTMLHHVSSDGYLEGMQRLVAAGANVNARNSEGRTALHTAAQYLFVDGIDYLLTVCFVDPNVTDTYRQTPLHDVVQKTLETAEEDRNGLKAVSSLLRASADWTLENGSGQLPLEMAESAAGIHPEIAEALECAQWFKENEPVSIWLKPGSRDAIVQLPRLIDNIPSLETFKIGMIRAKAASFFRVPAISIQLLYRGLELGDNSQSCAQEGMYADSVLDCRVVTRAPSQEVPTDNSSEHGDTTSGTKDNTYRDGLDPLFPFKVALTLVELKGRVMEVQKKIQRLTVAGAIPEMFHEIQTRLPLLVGLLDRTQNLRPEKLSSQDVEAYERIASSCSDQIYQVEEIIREIIDTDIKARNRFIGVVKKARAQEIATRLKDDIQLLAYLIEDSRSLDERKPGKEAQSPLLLTGIGSYGVNDITILEKLTDKVYWLLAARMENAPRYGQELFREISNIKPMLTRMRKWSEDESKHEAMMSTMKELFSPKGPRQDFGRVLASLASSFENRTSLDWPESIEIELPRYMSVVRARKSLLHSASQQNFFAVKEALQAHFKQSPSNLTDFDDNVESSAAEIDMTQKNEGRGQPTDTFNKRVMEDPLSPYFPDLEGHFEPQESQGGHLSDSQPLSEEIAEQQLRKTYWKLSFERVQFGRYRNKPACLLVVEAKFTSEDRKRHRFTNVTIDLAFDSEQKGEIKIQGFAPEWARGVEVPDRFTSKWAVKPKLSLSLGHVPATIDILYNEHDRRETYQTTKTALMEGVNKFNRKISWSLSEAHSEGIPLRVPSLVVLVTHEAHETGKHFKFKLKPSIDASIGLSMNPLRSPIWSMLSNPLQPILLDDTRQLIPYGNDIDPDFTSLDLQRLTKTSFTSDL